MKRSGLTVHPSTYLAVTVQLSCWSPLLCRQKSVRLRLVAKGRNEHPSGTLLCGRCSTHCVICGCVVSAFSSLQAGQRTAGLQPCMCCCSWWCCSIHACKQDCSPACDVAAAEAATALLHIIVNAGGHHVLHY